MLEDLHLKTIEHSKSDGEFNFVLSNGERTESESYEKMVEFQLPKKINRVDKALLSSYKVEYKLDTSGTYFDAPKFCFRKQSITTYLKSDFYLLYFRNSASNSK